MSTEYGSALPNDIREAVAISNVKCVAEQPSMLANLTFGNLGSNTNLSQQNAVSNQQSANQLGVAVTGKAVNLVSNLSPLEATALSKLDTGNDVAEQLADLKAEVRSFRSRSFS
jgi:killing trait domain-containing protein